MVASISGKGKYGYCKLEESWAMGARGALVGARKEGNGVAREAMDGATHC